MEPLLAEKPRAISDVVFRILSLQTEEQNEVEVLKPVLEELEVMRLSCALGALSSVHLDDFKCSMLEAKEFDTEFARFLRQDVFRSTCVDTDSSTSDNNNSIPEKQLRVLSLFGLQCEVKRELTRLGCWSSECDRNMSAHDQGIFCVKTDTLESGDNDSCSNHLPALVLFAWLDSALFEPQRLRDIVTYILRFLTCLSPSVVCCLSETDVMKVNAIVSDLVASGVDEWNSYSVAMCVEKQQDEKDEVRCERVQSLPVFARERSQSLRLIKGSFPALTAMIPSPTKTHTSRSKTKFHTPQELAGWLVGQAVAPHKLKLDFIDSNLAKQCRDSLLAATGRLPTTTLEAIRCEFDRRACESKATCRAHAKTFALEHRDWLLSAADQLFDFDRLMHSPHCNSELTTCLTQLKSERMVWDSIDREIKVKLHLPTRLAKRMHYAFELFKVGWNDALDDFLSKIVTTPNRRIREITNVWTTMKSRFSDWWSTEESLAHQFRAKMAAPLDKMRTCWMDTVVSALFAYERGLGPVLLEREMAALHSRCDAEISAQLDAAVTNLLDEWVNNPERELTKRIKVSRAYGSVACYIEREIAEPSTHKMEVFKIELDRDSSPGVRPLGFFPVHHQDTIVGVFSLQTRAILMVSTGPSRTSVERVQFHRHGDSTQGPVRSEIRVFPKETICCDFRASERMIAFVQANDSVVIYKFNEAFSKMEMTRSINLRTCTTLSLPVTNLLLLDSVVLCFDQSNDVQSVNIRSQQTSRKTSALSQRGSEGSLHGIGGALTFSDGLVVATMALRNGPNGDFCPALAAISSEDNRTVPVAFAEPLGLLSRDNVSVQAIGDALLVLDPLAEQIHVFDVSVTVRSDSFRIRQRVGSNGLGMDQLRNNYDNDEKDTYTDHSTHWLWTFFHLFEKFPVNEALSDEDWLCAAKLTAGDSGISRPPPSLQLKIAASSSMSVTSAPTLLDICKQYAQCIMEHLRRLNKPLGRLDLAKRLSVVDVSGSESASALAHALLHDVPLQSVAAFLQTLITFVPIQICRAESNMLVVMRDGQDTTGHERGWDAPHDPRQQEQQLQSADIARSIRFGLLSPLLESWCGRCIVVTSMGKQSTGKSYFLNHLTGSSFAIAGARCTDGAWMTLRVLPNDVILVVLDFEGLGSFERTEQEDVFLSVLNAAMSMFTVFRTEMRLDKETDEIFSRFQKGVQLIKNDPRLFRGTLCMSVKDVNPNDQIGVVNEVRTKIQKLLGANKEHNFLCEMYSGQLVINCSPPLGTSGYSQSLTQAQRHIQKLLRDESTGFENGRAFLDCIRLLLAKISILDWTALDESSQRLQLSEVRTKLPGVVRTGCLVPTDHVGDTSEVPQHLKEDLSLGNREVDLRALCVAYPELANKWHELDRTLALDSILDRDIDLVLDVCALGDDAASMRAMGESMERLFQRFLNCYMHRATAPAHQQHQHKLSVIHQSAFDLFLLFVTRRRKLRILAWARARLGDRLPDDWQALEAQHLGRFQMLFTRCARVCGSCQLGCMLPAAHSTVASEHDCGTNHRCQGRCEYCNELSRDISSINSNDCGAGGKTPLCAKPAGHEGKCECSRSDHTCGAICSLSLGANCEKKCVEMAGHAGQHMCAVQIHRCGRECSARLCTGRCILSVTAPHSAHKCEEVRCLEKCPMDGCSELCSEYDHFHGQTELAASARVVVTGSADDDGAMTKNATVFDANSYVPVTHMCAKAHHCQAMCGEQGNCCVEVFHKESSKTFEGKRGAFKYTFQEMNGFRKKCAAVLVPGQRSHLGMHTCVVTHTTAAGARREGVTDNDIDISDDEEKEEMKDNEGVSGDSSRVLHFCEARCPCCSYFCSKEHGHAGMHTTSHGNMRNTFFLADTDDIDVEERKYKAGESGTAEMCNLYCSKMGRAHVHYLDCEQKSEAQCVYVGDTADQRRHCTRALEPKPVDPVDELLHEQFWKTLGWEDPCAAAEERALFGECAYACDAPEHSDAQSFCALPAWHKPESKPAQDDGFSYIDGHKFECSHQLKSEKMHHVFVLDCSGSMCGAPWTQLLAAYREYIYNRVGASATSDVVSVVTFSWDAQIEYEAQDISAMLQAPVTYRGGGTAFAKGLRTASEVLSRNAFETYKPVLVFFSDGQPQDAKLGDELAAHIRQSFARYDLKAFVVGYGSVNLGLLKRLADKLGGAYHNVLVGTELKATFQTISASLATRAGLALTGKPLHESSCPICQRDLAAEDAETLQPCGHALHTSCKSEQLAKLVMCASGGSIACPVCRQPSVV